MEAKYAGGAYGRFRILYKPNVGVFAGVGPFYEYERWNNPANEDSLSSFIGKSKTRQGFKIASYISYKHKLTEKINIDFSIYYQFAFEQMISSPRLASSSKIGYWFTEHLELVFIYQNIYDFEPVVPIDKWFHRFIVSVSVSF